MSGEVLRDDDARDAIAAARSGITVEECRCGRMHVRLRYDGQVVAECVGTLEQVAAAAEVLEHVASRLAPGASTQYAAPTLAEGCLILSPGIATGKTRLAMGSGPVASVSIDVTAVELAGLAAAFGDAAARQAEVRSSRDDRFAHAELDAAVVDSCADHPDSLAATGCGCGCVHVYAVRKGVIALRLDLTPDEARVMGADITSAAGEAETLAAAAPKTN